jgi:hypothetical protein
VARRELDTRPADAPVRGCLCAQELPREKLRDHGDRAGRDENENEVQLKNRASR